MNPPGRSPFGAEFDAFSPRKKDGKGKPPFEPRQEWRCATQPGKLHIHLFQWPGAKVELTGDTPAITTACLLAGRAKRLTVSRADGKLTAALTDQAPDPIASVLCQEMNAGGRQRFSQAFEKVGALSSDDWK